MPDPLDPLDAIVAFLDEVGLPIRWDTVAVPSAVPGITLDRGTIVADADRLAHPGDLLHEAGHLAVLAEDERAAVDGNVNADPGNEMAAIAWSYAAALHIGIDPAVVFHEAGYRGDSASILENFRNGRFFGVPMLQWHGMTTEQRFPQMDRWVR